MTSQHDPDVRIRAFFQEGPAELSPRLLAGIRDDVHQTRQRALRRPWRTVSMPRTILIFATLGAVVLGLGALVVVGPGGHVAPSAAPTVAPSLAPSAAPSPTSAVVAYPLAAGDPWILVETADYGVDLVRSDGTDRHVILDGLRMHIPTFHWSPDGTRIVFEGNGDRGSQLWVADADGTNAHQLTATPTGCPNDACTEAVQPAWSPDGSKIAYVAPRHQSGTFVDSALMTLDLGSGATTKLFATTDTTLGRPTWAPDGRTIAFEIDTFGAAPEVSGFVSSVIAVIDSSGVGTPTPTTITDPSLQAGYPSWHPSEDSILFRTNRLDDQTKTLARPDAPSDLYTVKPDGTGLAKLTSNAVGGFVVRAPSWTPDGRVLFSKAEDPIFDEELRILDIDSSTETSATGTVITVGEGRWRPSR